MRAGSCCMPRRTCRTLLLGWSATTAPTRRPSPGRTGQSWRRMARHGARGRASSAPPTLPSRPTRRSRTSPPPRRRSSTGPSMPPRIPGNRRDAARDDLLLDRSSSALRPPDTAGCRGRTLVRLGPVRVRGTIRPVPARNHLPGLPPRASIPTGNRSAYYRPSVRQGGVSVPLFVAGKCSIRKGSPHRIGHG